MKNHRTCSKVKALEYCEHLEYRLYNSSFPFSPSKWMSLSRHDKPNMLSCTWTPHVAQVEWHLGKLIHCDPKKTFSRKDPLPQYRGSFILAGAHCSLCFHLSNGTSLYRHHEASRVGSLSGSHQPLRIEIYWTCRVKWHLHKPMYYDWKEKK